MNPLLLATLAVLLFLALVFAARGLRRYSRIDEWLWRWSYGRYLDSATWRQTARRVLRRDKFICQECGIQAQLPAKAGRLEFIYLRSISLQSHHLPGTYCRWTWYAVAPLLGLRENPDNLVTLCRPCHAKVHGRGE